jgi:hypothetical protein
MANQRRKNAKQPDQIDALARQSGTPDANVADAAAADAAPISEESAGVARLYLAPLGHLADLSPRLDVLIGGRWLKDPVGWQREVALVEQVLRHEKLRLKAIEAAARIAMRTRGGTRRIVTDAAAELSAKAAEAHNGHDGVKAQLQKLFVGIGERMYIYGTEFPELGLSADQESAFKNYIEDKITKPQSHRSGAGGGSRAISADAGPIQGLARALERSDAIDVARELGRLSAHVVERIGRRSAESDAIMCRGPAVDRAQRRELAQRYSDLSLESSRLPLIDLAIAGILRCIGGQQRLAMELEFRESQQSMESMPPRAQEILDRLSDELIRRSRTEPGEPNE